VQVCDLASLPSIRALADDIINGGHPLDVLVNNAGHLLHVRTPSADGYESNVGGGCTAYGLLLLACTTSCTTCSVGCAMG
jgi:NAD(P)-dependent dehydrogenase (short-subunit alcohol dehydrogenase family)